MTRTFTQHPSTTNLPTLPHGWPIGSQDTYREAQRAVHHLDDHEFAVAGITIVGVEPTLVERVDGRLTWRRVLAVGRRPGRGSVCSSACC